MIIATRLFIFVPGIDSICNLIPKVFIFFYLFVQKLIRLVRITVA